MALVTLADLKNQARERSDNLYSSYFTEEELNKMVNASAQELYDILVGVYEDYYFIEFPFSIIGGQDEYVLPTDFYKLRGLDEAVSPTYRITVKPFQWLERNYYIQPVNAHDLFLYYIPKMTLLVNDNDTFDGINGYEQYIITDVARKMMIKEESDPSAFMAELAQIKNRIETMGQNRNAGDSDRIQDINRQDAYIVYSFPQRLRYRLQGQTLQFKETYLYGNSYV
jgi:hypothetical protein